MSEHLNTAQFGNGLEPHDVPATEVQVGDKLDPRGRNHVHTVHPHKDKVLLGYSSKGARSGAVERHDSTATVRVWRKP